MGRSCSLALRSAFRPTISWDPSVLTYGLIQFPYGTVFSHQTPFLLSGFPEARILLDRIIYRRPSCRQRRLGRIHLFDEKRLVNVNSR
jgi:hypothetical protein